jgi:hypothetical protein
VELAIPLPIELQILIFSVSGVTLKLADFWGEHERSLPAYSSAILTAVLFGSLATQDPLNGALIFGLLLGVTVAQKVDRGNLCAGIIATILFAVLFQAPLPSLWLLIVVAIAASLDEVGHDRSTDIQYWYSTVFRFRPILKLVMIGVGVMTWIPYHLVINLLGFDLAYEGINLVLTHKK